MKDSTLNSAHKKLFELINTLYGEIEEETKGFSLGDHSSQQVAEELGYDAAQFSRLLSDARRGQLTDKACQRMTQRLMTVKESRQFAQKCKTLEEKLNQEVQKKKMAYYAIGFLLLFGSISSILLLKAESKNSSKQEFILTKQQRNAVLNLYSELMQNELALEAVLFSIPLQKGAYDDSLDYYFNQLQKSVEKIIAENRTLLEKTKCRAENGVYLCDIIDNMDNETSVNIAQLKRTLTNSNLSPRYTSQIIKTQVDRIQNKHRSAIDSLIASE